MKNFIIMNIKDFVSDDNKEYPVIHVKGINEKRDRKISFLRDYINELVIKSDESGYGFTIADADMIIRLCERCYDKETLIITYEESPNIALNIADVISVCYGIERDEAERDGIDFTYIPVVWRYIRLKYRQINNSPLRILPPMDYCKMILRLTLKDITGHISGEYDEPFDAVDFFWHRQCTVYLKSGIVLHFHLELTFANLFLFDIDDIEYVRFSSVPEISDPSAFGDNKFSAFAYDHYYGLYDFYGQGFNYDSVSGIEHFCWAVPEKCKDYKTIQREYYEFYQGKELIYPEMEYAYAGALAAESFLKEKGGYEPVLTDMPRYSPDELVFYTPEYLGVIDEVVEEMERLGKWDLSGIEYMCANAAYIYTGSLCACGHCENMTIVRAVFREAFRHRDDLNKFDRLWDIESYTPETSADPVNMLCLAAYSLIETARPFSGRPLPEDARDMVIRKAYELTEGRPELNNAVIMAGAFAGVYCPPVK